MSDRKTRSWTESFGEKTESFGGQGASDEVGTLGGEERGASRAAAEGAFPRARTLKRDSLGTVERVEDSRGRTWLVRFAVGGSVPGSGWVARRLLARERRALELAQGLAGLPQVPEGAAALAAQLAAGRGCRPDAVGVREFLEGRPLHRAERLPRDFFERLESLVGELHARGLCHNDLHKEQNVMVLDGGEPGLIDFQLASVHRRRGRLWRSRTGDDRRHVAKHRLRYLRQGRPKRPEERSSVALPRRSPVSAIWRRTGKPIYNLVTRRVLRRRDGEERRPDSGPWPEWSEPLGGPTGAADSG